MIMLKTEVMAPKHMRAPFASCEEVFSRLSGGPQCRGSLAGDGEPYDRPRAAATAHAAQRRAGRYVLDVVLPVYNEVSDLPDAVRRVHRFLATDVPHRARIVIADNASTDGTLEVARRLADEL